MVEVRYISPETEFGGGETELQGLTSPRAKPGYRVVECGHSYLAYPVDEFHSPTLSDEVMLQRG